ncbi:MAG TPA: CDP-diacylglycerol diphosphatase [Methylomirabilota bacterium]|nr:CDP-diacylglycerol diphosphatase [Methylomirabilota bacterium]
MRRALALFVLLVTAGCASADSSRDALRLIVEECLDPAEPRYCARCRWPQAGTCDLEYPCTRTTEVWAQSQEFVAIRDIKMCGCPAGFVHGLAMPRYPVSGIEDWRRADGLWRFGWEAARARIGDDRAIALVVNPPGLRTQDQLHIHLVRLLPQARPRVDALNPARVDRLEEVWLAAGRHAAGRGLNAYGVIVILASDGGWLVASEAGSPEEEYTIGRCGS